MSSITVKDEPIVEKMVQMGRGHLMDVVHKPDLPPRVSVIIPTYNRAQMVCACVDSVLRSDWPDMEVIVADDCSPDDTRRMVEERYRSDARVKYARTERNSLTSGARNQGARCATGDYYFFLDDDNLIEPDYITELLAVFGRHPSAAFVAPLTVHGAEDENRPVWTTGSYYNPWTSQGRDATPPNCRLNSLPEGLEWPTSYSSNAFMTTKVAFELVNGFDEGYGMQFDEADFGIRVTKQVGEGWISSRARTNHLGYVESDKKAPLRGLGIERPKRAYTFGRNRMKFARRHFRWYQAVVVMLAFAPMTACYYLLLAIRHGAPLCGLAYAGGTLAGICGLYRTIGFR